jgi:beta-mannosidase
MARARVLGNQADRPLDGVWELTALPPGRASDPASLDRCDTNWVPCDGPMTAAAALRARGLWSDEQQRDFDADDWWYRCRFTVDPQSPPARLRFEGLATIADVWLNGHHVLHSENMFLSHTVDITGYVRHDNELTLHFHALAPLVAPASTSRRPRPRWRAGLVTRQGLRWYRTALVGRVNPWCPPVAPVGPWRPIVLESSRLRIDQPDIDIDVTPEAAVVRVSLRASTSAARLHGTLSIGPATELGAGLSMSKAGDSETSLACERLSGDEHVCAAVIRINRPERWWPHTHGAQPLYDVRARLNVDGTSHAIDLGRVGFRTLEIDNDSDGHGFALVVNDTPVFCRGVCWTPLDLASLSSEVTTYRAALERLRDAGMNMIRIPGLMTYEVDAFYDLCDELGILLWQDFMFANLDYPWTDRAFADNATREVTQFLEGVRSRPSLAVVCGNSEVDQQAVMLGLPASEPANADGDRQLTALVRAFAPDVIWVPTTPTGGSFPFQANAGVSHYYGVGAYRRPLDDARRAGVRFAAECLAFSNVPNRATVDLVVNGVNGDRERWQARVPRDPGSESDFEDVRDWYVEQIFDVDAAALRERDFDRYLALGRIATGEAMLRTFAEWRRPGSTCRGGLVWFAQDLWPGAGWGIVDSLGRPKPAYWYLARGCAPLALLVADEGLNGLWLHVVNDTGQAVEGELRVATYSNGVRQEPAVCADVEIPARGHRSIHANALFESFRDLTCAYRFGSLEHDLVACTLRDRVSGAVLASAHYFPHRLPAVWPPDVDIRLTARVESIDDRLVLALEAARCAYAVEIDFDDFVPDDNYLYLEPGETRRIGLRPNASCVLPAEKRGRVSALNSQGVVHITLAETVDVR